MERETSLPKEREKRQQVIEPTAPQSEPQVSTLLSCPESLVNRQLKAPDTCNIIAPDTEQMTAMADIINTNTDFAASFSGGRLKHYISQWGQITRDPFIRNIVSGYTIEFSDTPFQPYVPAETKFSATEVAIVRSELTKLLDKKVIVQCTHDHGEFISPIFLREKKDRSSWRVILNLKGLNKFVEDQHFKMETLETVFKLMKPGAFAGSLDLKDAYYSVPIHDSHTKYLKFSFGGKLYKFVALPNGLKSGPRIFTKLMRVLFSELRKKGLESSIYLDDVYLQGDTSALCQANILTTAKWLMKFGFVIHPVKSVFYPTRLITHVGFSLNLEAMTVSIPHEKAERVRAACETLLTCARSPIREVARVIGSLVACFPATRHGKLHYRNLELDKISALRNAKGKYDKYMVLTPKAVSDLHWWIEFLQSPQPRPLVPPPASKCILSDASDTGWGGVVRDTDLTAGGLFTEAEQSLHINAKEILGAFFCLKAFCKCDSDTHVKLLVDNTTAVSYVREMGGTHSRVCNQIACQIWEWAANHNIWLSIAHVPGVQNIDADHESRHFHKETEWQLKPIVFKHVVAHFAFPVDTDLMASRTNCQVAAFMSWRPDPNAMAIDAFSINWHSMNFWCFPPFSSSLILQVLAKIRTDCATGLMVVPFWPTQPWYPVLLQHLVAHPRVLPKSLQLLQLPEKPGECHPLQGKLQLLVCKLSGDLSKIKDYQCSLLTLSSMPGDLTPRNNMHHISPSGQPTVVNNRLIQFIHLFPRC